MDFLQNVWINITDMGIEHNVDPILFAILYFGTIPPYMGSMVWAIKNHKKQKNIVLPVFSTLFFFILPALYVIFFGKNVAWWVYAIIAFIIGYGLFGLYQKMKSSLQDSAS